MLPKPIRTAQDLAGSVVLGKTAESGYLEFKATYEWKGSGNEAAADEVCRDIVQFANADGGTLLIGIGEQEVAPGTRVAAAGPGVSDPDGLVAWIERAIRNHLVPATFAKDIARIPFGDGLVVAVNVAPSPHLVALWNPEKKRGIEYLYRTSTGKEWMNPDDVERHLLNQSRAAMLGAKRVFDVVNPLGPARLALLVPPMELVVGVTAGAHRELDADGTKFRPSLSGVGDHELELLLSSGLMIKIPYALVRAVWLTTDKRPALALSVRIVIVHGGSYYLEPI